MKKKKKSEFFSPSEAKAFAEKYRKNFTKVNEKTNNKESGSDLHTYFKEMHTYKQIKGNSIYNGMPEFSEDFNPYHEDFPLYCTLLLKIASIPMHQITWGKVEQNGNLVEQRFRQYEFQLWGDVADGFGVMHLFIKDKNHFFNEQETFKVVQGWQKIPLTYETMSKMSQEELTTIYFDFD